MATEAERNARLDKLVTATKAWATQRRAELQHRVDSNKKILRGRTGSERLAQAAVQAASDLVVAEVDDFLLASS